MVVVDLECAAGIVAEGEDKSTAEAYIYTSTYIKVREGWRIVSQKLTDCRSRLIDLPRSIISIRVSELPHHVRHMRQIQTTYSNHGV